MWLFTPFFRNSISWLRIWIILFTVYTFVAEMLIFSPVGVSLSVLWWKTCQYRQRTLHVPCHVSWVPIVPFAGFDPFCKVMQLSPLGSFVHFPTRSGWLPLTVRVFQSILITYLSTLGIIASDYSGLRFRRGGATFALECGIPQR